MRHLTAFLFLTIVIGLAAACEPEKVEETAWDDQIEALEKARDVEKELLDRAEQLRKDLDPNYKSEDDDEDSAN